MSDVNCEETIEHSVPDHAGTTVSRELTEEVDGCNMIVSDMHPIYSMANVRVLASVTFTEKVVPVVSPESKRLEVRGVHGSLKEDWVTECCTVFLRGRQTRNIIAGSW